jgi:hypothetical protein
MSFFDSEIVQHEARNLFQDYQALTQLGSSYGKFDREGKILFIEKMEEMMDRYKIFMKRFELSDDFMAQMTLKQLQSQLGNFGITPQQMFDQMNLTLDFLPLELWACHNYYGTYINISRTKSSDRFADRCASCINVIT